MTDPVAVCADASAAWHSSWLTALGVPWERSDDVWRALAPPHFIYFAAITLRPDVPAAAVADAPGAVCDNWDGLELEGFGRRIFRQEPWFFRTPGPARGAIPSELEIVRVRTEDEVAEFELVSVRGFGHEDATIGRGTMHPASVLEDPAMAMFLGRADGRPVAAAMGYVTDAAVGVFGVTTIASARGRGYATALTRAAMLTDTGLPAVLAPSEGAESMYLKLGFERVGALTIWTKQ